MFDVLKGIISIGFLFFLIKGICWILVFILLYFGILKPEKLNRWKNKFNIFKKKKP